MAMNLASVGAIEWTRDVMFLGCALVGGTILALQTIMLLFGFGGVDDIDGMGDGDFELDGTESAFGFLSVRAVSAFLTFFGLAGWGASTAGWNLPATLGIALVSGLGIMFVVVYILSLQKKLYSEGNLHPETVVGSTARVYLRIPARATGKGKITVAIQGRSVQFEATSAATCELEIATGAEVRIARMITPGSFEVEAL